MNEKPNEPTEAPEFAEEVEEAEVRDDELAEVSGGTHTQIGIQRHGQYYTGSSIRGI